MATSVIHVFWQSCDNLIFTTYVIISLTLFFTRSFYFMRVASQHGCAQCQERVSPEEVKSALGVCTVYLVKQTIEWITNKE